MIRRSRKHNRAFTLIELMVCITIFVIMTALMLAKYGNFNQSVLLTNLAYDMALQLRTAQNYGLSVKNVKNSAGNDVVCNSASTAGQAFQCAYGIAFSSTSGTDFNKTTFILFADMNNDNAYDGSSVDQLISTYTLKRGATIGSLVICISSDCSQKTLPDHLFVTFRRPDPTALITVDATDSLKSYAKITIKGTDGSTRTISVRDNGQISVDI